MRCLPVLVTALSLYAQADLVLRNARVWTGDPKRPWADSLAIKDGRIAATVRTGPETQVADLGGKLVIPGFHDAHIHFAGGSLRLFQVDLTGICTLKEMQRAVADYARANPDEAWITGSGWEYYCFPDSRLPRKQDLDAVVADRPVFLRTYDGHTGWANSMALRIAEITRDTKFEGFGEIVRDASGEPSGALKEGAMGLVGRHLPRPTRERRLEALRRGMSLAASLGITSIQNAGGGADELSLYEELLRRNELTLRVRLAVSAGKASDAEIAAWPRRKEPMLSTGAVKFSIDGVIESKTAAMLEPYSDGSTDRGPLSWKPDEFQAAVARCHAAGWQILVHAIGDAGVRTALDAFQAALRTHPARDPRFRIEHIEIIHPDDVPRFAALGVLPSMQPIHADPDTIHVWSRLIGDKRLPYSFPWRSLESAGARLVFSSDWPASISLAPIRGIHNAVNRRTIAGTPNEGWLPHQRVTLETALRAYTVAGAYASFEEEQKGTLTPGKYADLVVLSQDPFRIDPIDIHKTRVLHTLVGGKQVYGDLRGPARIN